MKLRLILCSVIFSLGFISPATAEMLEGKLGLNLPLPSHADSGAWQPKLLPPPSTKQPNNIQYMDFSPGPPPPPPQHAQQ